MIAANYRRHADALIAQLELDLVAVGASTAQRATWREWLMQSGIVQRIKATATPAWFAAAARRAKALANAIRAATKNLF